MRETGKKWDQQFIIGVIGDIPALMSFWEMFKEKANDKALREIGIVAVSLPGQNALPGMQPSSVLPTYKSYDKMLAVHPEINMVIEATGREDLVAELRASLPSRITLVERGCANFFIKLLTTDKMWVACKLDLMHTQAMLKTIVDQLHDAMIFADRNGKIMDLNQAACDSIGRSKKEVIHKQFMDYFGDPTTDKEDPFEVTVSTGEAAEARVSHLAEDGRVRYYRMYTHPILDEAGDMSHVVVVRRDITGRTRLEQRLLQSEKLASIGELSTYIAHEIRNPLFTISGFANSLMRDPDLGDKAREKLDIILSESRRLDVILKSIMNFTRPTNATEESCDLNKTVNSTLEVLCMGCEQQDITLVKALKPSIANVQADPELVQQCLINMVKNAMEAMPDGGELMVRTDMVGERVSLKIEDTGIGIPVDIQEQVFSPFFSSKGKGAGIGLAMVRKIMDEIGGDVDLVSTEGKGTAITLILPPALAVAQSGDAM